MYRKMFKLYVFFLKNMISGCLDFLNFDVDNILMFVLYLVRDLNLYIIYFVKVIVINGVGEGYFVNVIVLIDEEGIFYIFKWF